MKKTRRFLSSLMLLFIIASIETSCSKDEAAAPPADTPTTPEGQSTHTITIDPNKYVASVLMSQAEYDSWKTNDDFANDDKRQALVKDIYKKFKDDFDFIFLVLNETNYPSTLQYTGQMKPVANNIQGLGITAYDDTAKFGSAGKLKGVIQLCKKTNIQNGPTLHELCHYWGNFIVPTAAGFDYGSGFVALADAKPHWGFTGGSSKGQMGGFLNSSIVRNGVNSYTVNEFGWNANGGNYTLYSEMELYLMGLIPITSIKDFSVFTDIKSYSQDATSKKITFTGTEILYNQTKLKEVLGTRVPSSADSQKQFKLMFVVLTPTELTAADWDGFSKQSAWFGNTGTDTSPYVNFYEATAGKATAITGDLDKSLLQ